MNDKLKRIRERREKLSQKSGINIVPSQDSVDTFLNSKVSNSLHSEIEARLQSNLSSDVVIEKEDVQTLLTTIEEGFQEQTLDDLFQECKKTVLDTCIRQFGLAGVLFQDRDGGNVDTIHNSRNGIYATDDAREAYDNRGEYDSHEYHSHENYIKKNKSDKIKQQNGTLEDAYTDSKIGYHDNRDLDHTISAKGIHDDPGRTLAGLDGAELANAESNLNSTDRSINRSKKQDSVDDFAKRLNETSEARNSRIAELNSKGDLSDKERKELKKLNSLNNFDEEKAKEVDKKARKEYEKKINKAYYNKDFIKNTAKAGAKEGAKMGVQQALGLVLRELTLAVFSEAKDILKNGMVNEELGDSFWIAFKERLTRISKRIMSKWKDVLVSFRDGFISGFISNLITVITNTFKTTFKNINRIIREGVYSLFKAVKLLVKPPENMSKERVYHEVTKLLATSVVVSGGIVLEEVLDKYLKAFPFANIVSDILLGTLTGILSCVVLYALDKVDIFGCNRKEKHDFIITKLNEMIEKDVAEALSV